MNDAAAWIIAALVIAVLVLDYQARYWRKECRRLRAKLPFESSIPQMTSKLPMPSGVTAPPSQNAVDALSALRNMGYAKPLAQEMVKAAITRNPASAGSLDALIRESLRRS